MEEVLNDTNVIAQRDPGGALGVVGSQYQQAAFNAVVENAEHDDRQLENLVITGMGGSALAALLLKTLLKDDLAVPLEIVRGYDLPAYVGSTTLVIASSYSGNTEETVSALAQARQKGAQVGVLASGGKLIETASQESIAHVVVPTGLQPRMATIYSLRALFALLKEFGLTSKDWLGEIAGLSEWLRFETASWAPEVPLADNYAKQLAVQTVGKTPVFYGGPLTGSLAYKFKISWNESAKNIAFWNEYPEFNHNEFLGWTSHPVEKPFAVFDILSTFERPRIVQRFELSDRLLSGQRPHAQTIELRGGTLVAQLLWGAILADFASCYTGILNNVDPTPVVIIEKLKQELAADPR